MESFWEIFSRTVEILILLYSILITGSYVILWVVSSFFLNRYMKEHKTTDYHKIINSPLAPKISLIAPCYNEGRSIVSNIRALLNLHYNNYEVIVVNDGSTDNSLNEAIKAYELERVNYFINERLTTQKIRGVYRSRNKAYHNLTVIDKENGGKSDALNAGLNVADNPYVVCLDVDSIIEHDALLKLSYPFMKSYKSRLIAVGGVVHVANSCKIEAGRMIQRRVPGKLLPRIQVIEYARAFMIGRIAWSKLGGLLLVSGAIGMFDKEIVIKSGGYLTGTVGEDMELVVRMRRYMYNQKIKHQVVYMPDPLLWTEVPAEKKTLGKQRNRWTRGTMDTLFIHRKIFFNPKYGQMGLLGYPYWFFFEWLAPIVEVLGLIYFALMAMLGAIHWPIFFTLLVFIYLFSLTFSFFSILLEELLFPSYEKSRENLSLFLTALVEPFIYHPLVVYWSIRGNISFLRGNRTWGAMKRTGFGENK